MCDTLVAFKGVTRENVTIFAKNSDRDPNEAQVVEYHPRRPAVEERVMCTYIDVEQVDEVYAVFICRPYWMWGAEMGVNEHSVAIGNEAVFTRLPYARTGLTGMDLVRLALERSRSAKEAVDWITRLLEEYGQGGSCSATRSFYYHNSFLIADPGDAWILETAGREWVAKRVRDVGTISNALLLGSDWDSASEGIVEQASKEEVIFAERFSDRFYTRMAKGRERQAFTQRKLEEAKGSIDFFLITGLLRSHSFEPYDPCRGSMRDVCMHAGGLTRPSQTACSLVALLYERAPLAFVTGTSTPCISMFKPVLLDAGLPDLGPAPTGRYDGGKSYWWRHEALSRRINSSYQRYAPLIASEMRELEREFHSRALNLRESYLRGEAPLEAFRRLTLEAFEAAAKVEEKWLQRVEPGHCFNLFYAFYWRSTNRAAIL